MSHLLCDKSRAVRSGLTLLEMVIVLGILAMLATVAVRSLEPLADQTRYEVTKRQLEVLQTAVADPQPPRQPDQSLSITGFVADVGRLPVDIAELWEGMSGDGFAFQTRSGPDSPVDYSAIRLPCGWRGPYLHPERPELGVRDGWGQPFIGLTTPIRGNEQIQGLSWNPRPDYEALHSDWSHAMTTVSGVLTSGGEPADGTVVLLYPDPPEATLAVLADSDDTADGAFLFRDVPVGLRAIRATIGAESVTRYIQVPPQGLTLTLNVMPSLDANP